VANRINQMEKQVFRVLRKLAQAVQSPTRMAQILAVTLFFAQLVHAAVEPSITSAPNSETITNDGYYSDFGEKKKEKGHSVAPVIGYDPTYSFVVGAAYFYMDSDLSFAVDANTNFGGVYQLHARAVHQFSKSWNYEIRLAGMKGFEAYYGNGGDTLPGNYQQLWGDRYTTRLQLSHQLTDHFSLGAFTELRGRSEGSGPNGIYPRVAPDQNVGAVGVSVKLDSRKDKTRSNDGVVLTTELTQSFPSFNSPSQKPFTQLESSFVVYKDVMGDFLPGVVAAFQLAGGISDGEVPFAYRYRFGGAGKMRGYLENRFRGNRYYLQQTELRVPIWRMIGGAFSLGFGDISDRDFTAPKMCYGMGIRIGLPPDWVSQIRIDVGFARDQMGVFAEFGQTF
jgi:outer membrane protein assembly factor BamA